MSTVRIQVRRGTADQWSDVNPILAAGEMGLESDTNFIKFGNGTDRWDNLPYANDPTSFDISNTLSDYVLISDVGNAGGPAKLDADGNLLVPKSSIILEGATADAYETTLTVTDPTADRTITFPNASGTVVLADGSGNVVVSGDLTVNGTTTTVNSTQVNIQNAFVFEGATADAYETTLTTIEPTADRTISLPNASGTIALTSDIAELSQDAINSALTVGSGLTKNYNDLGNAIELAIDPTVYATVSNVDTQINGIQTQINTTLPTVYAPIASPSFTGTVSGITKSMVGLANVDNTADTNKPVSTAMQTALNLKANLESPTFTGNVTLPNGTVSNAQVASNAGIAYSKLNLTGSIVSADITNGTIVNEDISSSAAINQSKISNLTSDLAAKAPLSSPTFTGTVSGITKTMVGLGNVDNTSDGDKPVSSATQTALDAKLSSSTAETTYAPIASPTFTGTVAGITKSMVGLGSVDNTSDANKPVSTETQTALNAKLALAGGTMTGALTLSGAPTSDLHAATKQYVDGIAAGINFHAPVVAATAGNLAGNYNNGTNGYLATLTKASNGSIGTIDGATVAVGNRILLRAQTDAKQNGIYVITALGDGSNPWVITRASDADNNPAGELSTGDFCFVTSGSTNGSKGFILSTTGTITIGTTDIAYSQFNASEAIIAGTNISKSGATISVVDAPTFSGIITASSGVSYSDGTQTKQGVPSITPIISKTSNYTLTSLTERDSLIEVNSTSPVTITIPTNSAVAFPVGTTLDILGVNTGLITIAGDTGVIVNATPGLKLRTQWSSCTLFKRGENAWVVYGDLKA
jgi:hypothetical protein